MQHFSLILIIALQVRNGFWLKVIFESVYMVVLLKQYVVLNALCLSSRYK